jgi:flagellar biosynthesis anti-sigma factor FlgM
MIIRDKSAAAVSQLYTRRLTSDKPSQAKSPTAQSAQPAHDDVEISSEAQALQKASAEPAGDEVRWDKVAQLRQRIEQGKYEVPVNDLVQRLLGEG